MNALIKWWKDNMTRDPAYSRGTLYTDPPYTPDYLTQYEHPMATAHYKAGPHDGCQCRVCGLQRTIRDLEELKKASLAALADINLMEVCSELSIPHDVGMSKKILPAIRFLKQQIQIQRREIEELNALRANNP